MKIATLATVTALAALIVATPGVSATNAEAGVKVRANNKVTPRIRVRPNIRVRVNTKRMLQKKKTGNTHIATVPVVRPAKSLVTPQLVSTSPQDFSRDPAFESAITELGRKLADIDLGDIDVSGIAHIDVAAVDLAFPVRGFDDDAADSTDGLEGGLDIPGRNRGAWDPNDVLPDQPGKPDTGHLGVNVDTIGDSVAGDGPVTLPVHNTKNTRDDGVEVYSEWTPGPSSGLAETMTIKNRPDGSSVVTHTVHTDSGDFQNVTENPPVDSTDTAELRNPDAPGDAVIPVNCGSVACNEARKGKGLDLTTTPGAQVLPADPNGNNTGIVADAPRTNDYWREAATTNPGTEPSDNDENRRGKLNNDQVLPLEEADGTIPTPGGR